MEYPDAPNHLAFPVRWWLPGDVVRGSIVYRFTGPEGCLGILLLNK